jgi:hypothetical protein
MQSTHRSRRADHANPVEDQKGFVKDILEQLPEANKPAYNTVSTIVRILRPRDL